MKKLYGEWASNKDNPVVVEMKERFGNLVLKIMVRAIAGKRYFRIHASGDCCYVDRLIFRASVV